MSRTLWNEGRVVGYSAYEVYIRQLMADDPTATPASEKEWLTSMLALGGSMLLYVAADATDSLHYVEYDLPEGCRLVAANNILASFFIGNAYLADASAHWPSKVVDYGPLISNTEESHPTGNLVPPANVDLEDFSDDTLNAMKNYMKVVDGLVIQPGTWTVNSPSLNPYEDFSPTLAQVPKIRLMIDGAVDTPFFILLTGFTDKGIIGGMVKTNSAVNTSDPANGDFLGPAAFPWATKILFSVPSAFVNKFVATKSEYVREFPKGETALKNDMGAVIDMATCNPELYYFNHTEYLDATKDIEVISITGIDEHSAVLMTYQPSDNLPPALYGSMLWNGHVGLWPAAPIDTVAPGTPKIFDRLYDVADVSTSMSIVTELEDNALGTVGILRDIGDTDNQPEYPATYVLYQHDTFTDAAIPVAKVDKTNLFGMLVAREIHYNGIETTANVVGPYLAVEGSIRSNYFEAPVLNSGDPLPAGYDLWTETDWKMKLKDEYSVIKSALPTAAQADIDNTGYISAATIQADRNPYCQVLSYIGRRITGRLSNIIQQKCGYTVYDSNEELTPAFSTGGYWQSATKNLWDQITAGSKSDYYGVVMGTEHSNNWVWPVHQPDHVLDITTPMEFNIIANGNPINLVGFENSDTAVRSTKLLGSYWNLNTGSGYKNGWAFINRTTPTYSSTLPASATGQITNANALLPVSGHYNVATLSSLYTADVLNVFGIHEDYWNLPLNQFLKIAVYTDVGTKQPLSPDGTWSSRNIKQPQTISKAVPLDSSGQSTAEVEAGPILNLFNSASSVGKVQLIPIPAEYQSTDPYPVGTLVQTGRLQSVALSMLDKDGVPYILEGSAGDIIVPDTGLTWEDLITALYQNKSLDILGDKLTTLRSNIKTVGADYIEFQNGKRITGV